MATYDNHELHDPIAGERWSPSFGGDSLWSMRLAELDRIVDHTEYQRALAAVRSMDERILAHLRRLLAARDDETTANLITQLEERVDEGHGLAQIDDLLERWGIPILPDGSFRTADVRAAVGRHLANGA